MSLLESICQRNATLRIQPANPNPRTATVAVRKVLTPQQEQVLNALHATSTDFQFYVRSIKTAELPDGNKVGLITHYTQIRDLLNATLEALAHSESIQSIPSIPSIPSISSIQSKTPKSYV